MHALGAGAHTRTHGVMAGRSARRTRPSLCNPHMSRTLACHVPSHVHHSSHMSLTAAREPATGVNSLWIV